MQRKYLLAGGRGFLGRALTARLRARGDAVVLLTRSRPQPRTDGAREVAWDGRTPGAWAAELEGAAGLVNLAGSSIACVHTEPNRRALLQSRLDAVRVLGAAVAECTRPPTAWVQASAVGYYGFRDTAPADESTPAGADYLAEICRQWEAALAGACPPAVRCVVLRLGVVLGRDGGALPRLARVTRAFAGGAAGTGRQGLSWIHLGDVAGIFLRALDPEAGMRGAYNACAPAPVGNGEFMRLLRRVLHRPWSPPAPAWALRLLLRHVLRTEPALVLAGQYVHPTRLLAEGHRFRHPALAPALADLLVQ